MFYLNDSELAERYVNSVVGARDLMYGMLLLRIYNDGFLTSGGFFDELLVPDEPQSIHDADDLILLHAVAATELPVDFYKKRFIFANEKEILEEADRYLTIAMLSKSDTHEVVGSLSGIDLEQALAIANMDRPAVISPDTVMEHRVYIDSKGRRFSWALMLPDSMPEYGGVYMTNMGVEED